MLGSTLRRETAVFDQAADFSGLRPSRALGITKIHSTNSLIVLEIKSNKYLETTVHLLARNTYNSKARVLSD